MYNNDTYTYNKQDDPSFILFMQWLDEFEEELYKSIDLDKMEEDYLAKQPSTTNNNILSQNPKLSDDAKHRVNIVIYTKELLPTSGVMKPIIPIDNQQLQKILDDIPFRGTDIKLANNPNYTNYNQGA